MDLFALLKQDHQKTRKDLQDLIALCRKEDNIDIGMLEMARRELQLHMDLEERMLYPRAEEEEDTADLIPDAFDEHQQVKDLLSQLQGNANTDQIASILEEILKNVEHHVQEEENELFPKLQKVWDRRMLEEMGHQVQEAKQRELSR